MPFRLLRTRRVVLAALLAPGLVAAGSLSAGALGVPETAVRPQVAQSAGEADEPTTSTIAVPDTAADDTTTVAGDDVVAERDRTATDDFQMVGLTWSSGADAGDVTAEVRTRRDGAWSGWQSLDPVDPGDGTAPTSTEPLWVGDADGVAARVMTADGASLDGVRIATVDSPEQPQDAAIASSAGDVSLDSSSLSGTTASFRTASLAAARKAPAQPAIVMRSQWKPNTAYESTCSYSSSSQVGALLHHTAGANTYTREQAPSYVRAAHLYHTKVNKWCDVGYNFLVDKYGTIYEGRRGGITKMIRGAHSGHNQSNAQMVGISMLGNYDTVGLTSPLKTSVANLIAWRFGLVGTPALGKISMDGFTINRISGHRDVRSTACPGRYGYAWLNESGSGGLRGMVAARLAGTATGGTVTTPAPRISGVILTTYNAYKGYLGANTSAIARASGGYTYANFANGRVYAKGSKGYAIWGAIDKAHRAAKGTSGVMGVPTGSVRAVTGKGVWFAPFAHGRIYSRGSSAYYSYGKVDAKHRSLKGVAGRLGAPTSSVYRTKKGNYKATYVGGSISYNARSNKYSVRYK